MLIGIIGGGVVGSATARVFSEVGHEIGIYDLDRERRTHDLIDLLNNADLTFVCLPTPQKERSLECDTSALDRFFISVRQFYHDRNFVIRSTVPIGYTRRIYNLGFPNVVHSPEFLTARTAYEDARNPRLVVIGSPGERAVKPDNWSGAILVPDSCAKLAELYQKTFPTVDKCWLTSDESEMMKLAMNSFFAVKVAFWNEVHRLCTTKECDYSEVIEAILAEGRVHPIHTKVPGPDGKFGFGGSCLPKDLASFIYQLDPTGNEGGSVALAAYLGNEKDRRRTI